MSTLVCEVCKATISYPEDDGAPDGAPDGWVPYATTYHDNKEVGPICPLCWALMDTTFDEDSDEPIILQKSAYETPPMFETFDAKAILYVVVKSDEGVHILALPADANGNPTGDAVQILDSRDEEFAEAAADILLNLALNASAASKKI